jgi:hypothetical protein
MTTNKEDNQVRRDERAGLDTRSSLEGRNEEQVRRDRENRPDARPLDPRRETPGFLSDEKEKRERLRDQDTLRVKLVRSIILDGEHAEEGTVHEVPRPMAHRLVGEGSAVHHENPDFPPTPEQTAVTTTNRMLPADTRDPATGTVTRTRPVPTVKQY